MLVLLEYSNGVLVEKRPSKSQIDALVKGYALKVLSQSMNAPIRVQQGFHTKFNKALSRLQSKFPAVDMTSGEFFQQLQDRAVAWNKKRAMKGPGVDW